MTHYANERVLSIQSHVAFGYVGGKAAVFPLQCLGYDVDVINTVNFSNHSGYGRFGGTKTSATELTTVFQLMEQNGLLTPGRLLTGYIPGAEALSAVATIAKKLKKENDDLIYLLDPVMGDAGKLYVASDVIPVYRSMLPLASVITPNWFEVEVLTEIQLKDFASLHRALTALHTKYCVPHVVISSIPLTPWLAEALPPDIRPPLENGTSTNSEFLLCIASSLDLLHPDSLSTVHAHYVPLIPGYFSGVGDLFSALLLGHFHPKLSSDVHIPIPQTPLSFAASLALTKTHGILSLTHEYAVSLPEEDRLPTDEEKDAVEPLRKIRRMKGRELRLVQGQDIIRTVGVQPTRWMHKWNNFWNAK